MCFAFIIVQLCQVPFVTFPISMNLIPSEIRGIDKMHDIISGKSVVLNLIFLRNNIQKVRIFRLEIKTIFPATERTSAQGCGYESGGLRLFGNARIRIRVRNILEYRSSFRNILDLDTVLENSEFGSCL